MARASVGENANLRRWRMTAASRKWLPSAGPSGRRAEMGRRAHQPDPAQRRQGEAMAAYGIPGAEIAKVRN